MTYNKFEKLIKKFTNQFVIYTKDGRILFLRPEPYFNGAAVLATNEKSFELEIIEYYEIDYVVIDGQKYK